MCFKGYQRVHPLITFHRSICGLMCGLCVYLYQVKYNWMSPMARPLTERKWSEGRWPPVHQTFETGCSWALRSVMLPCHSVLQQWRVGVLCHDVGMMIMRNRCNFNDKVGTVACFRNNWKQRMRGGWIIIKLLEEVNELTACTLSKGFILWPKINISQGEQPNLFLNREHLFLN